MTVYVSLLRGINVGGNKKIRMADLKTLYESLGLSDVQTLLQSGNVVFRSDSTDAGTLAGMIAAAIEAHYGFTSSILLRTGDEWRQVVGAHPYTDDQLGEPAKILVAFLDAAPDAARFSAMQQDHTGPEMLHLQGRELYLFYPEGMGRSKLENAVIERRLKVTSSGRNWNTVKKLYALVSEAI